MARTFLAVFAAIGVISAADDLLPTLARLSMIVGWVASAYQAARDWLWQGIEQLVQLVGFQMPHVPEIWRDAAVVFVLIFSALNFESVTRHRQLLLFAYIRTLFRQAKRAIAPGGGDLEGLFEEQYPEWIDYSLAAGFYGVVAAIAISAAPSNFLSAIHVPAPSLTLGALTAVVFATLMIALGRVSNAEPGYDGWATRTLFTLAVPPSIVVIPIVALVNGWRSILLALVIVGALVLTNSFFPHLIDPFILHPPAWFTDFMEAGRHRE